MAQEPQSQWLPIVVRKNADQSGLKDCVTKFVPPDIETACLPMRAAGVMRHVACRARASATGPDLLSYRAWAETAGALEASEELSRSFWETGRAPPSFVVSVFSFGPKGSKGSGPQSGAQGAGNFLPITRKSSDSQIFAAALNQRMRRQAELHARPIQQGLVRGRS